MKQDLFQFLPSEITFNILSRLPVRGIATSKCVCNQWLDLLSTDEFINSYLPKPVLALTALIVELERFSVRCKVYELEDEDKHEDEADDDDDVVDRRHNPLTYFKFPHGKDLQLVGAADGLLLLRECGRTLYICNPITREYVNICCAADNYWSFYGFGMSKMTGLHKAVQIIHERRPDRGCNCDVNVYTLETGSWRRVKATTELHLGDPSNGAFINGKLHWIGNESITCFDLETECFSMFSAAPVEIEIECIKSIRVLEDYLCVCHEMPSEDHAFVIEIWLMKEYGVEKSWTKEHVIRVGSDYPMDITDGFYLIKVFKNGDILIRGGDDGWVLFRYSKKTQAARRIGMLEPQHGLYRSTWHLTPSFLSLKRNLGMENVISF